MRHNRFRRVLALAAVMSVLAGCAGLSPRDDPKVIRLWTHVAGNPDELSKIERIITDFNASQDEYEVVHVPFGEGDYNAAVTASAGASLPCLLDVDSPMVPNWAWANYLIPLDLPRDTVERFLPSTVGRYHDKIYSIGFYDASMALFARRSVLERNRLRVPTMDQPWTLAEFEAALLTLKAAGYPFPLDLGTGIDPGEWWSYAYLPMLQSFGGDLLDRAANDRAGNDRAAHGSAQGALNGPVAVAFGRWWQSLFSRGLADAREEPDRQAFLRGETALAWDGSWAAIDALRLYEDVLFLPPPDLGRGPKVGSGSWQWGITSTCNRQAGALAYLRFSLNPKYLAAFADSVGLIPATEQAAAMTKSYKPGGQLRVFAEYARKYGQGRPATPAYPAISGEFASALREITDGVGVKARLDQAVAEIERDLRSNNYYG